MVAQKLSLTKIGIHNIKSIDDCVLDIGDKNYVFGRNNSGKSNLLFAINLAFGNARLEREDLFISADSPFSEDKIAYIDLLFEPEGGTFDEDWMTVLGPTIIVEKSQSFGFRTIFEYDGRNNSYHRRRKVLKSWSDQAIPSEDSVTESEIKYFECFFINAQRDISEDIRNRQSLWNRKISSMEIPDGVASSFQETVRELNDDLVKESEVLSRLTKEFEKVPSNGRLVINPLPVSTSDLYNGLDIKVDQNGTLIPVSSIGLGSRSIATITAIETLSNIAYENDEPHYTLILIEEPEEHLHPHLQSVIGEELRKLRTQVILTTHSLNIIGTADLKEMIHIGHDGARSKISRYRESDEQDDKVTEQIRRRLPMMLFSRVVIFVEGRTEENALPRFFERRFGYRPEYKDISFIRVEGNKSYYPFLKMAREFDLDWLIFSDGEEDTKKAVTTQLKSVFSEENGFEQNKVMSRVYFIPNHMNYESYIASECYDSVYGSLSELYNEDTIRKKLMNIKNDDLKEKLAKLLIDFKGKLAPTIAVVDAICDDKTVPPLITELLDRIERRIQT